MKPTSLAPNFVANASVKVRKALPPAHRPLPACPGARASQNDLCGCGALLSRARRARPLFLSPLLRAGRAFPQRRRARGLDWRAGRALDVLLCFLNWRLSMSVAAHMWLEPGVGAPPPAAVRRDGRCAPGAVARRRTAADRMERVRQHCLESQPCCAGPYSLAHGHPHQCFRPRCAEVRARRFRGRSADSAPYTGAAQSCGRTGRVCSRARVASAGMTSMGGVS